MDSIRYLRRKNLGNYEHEELEVSTVVEDGQDRAEVTRSLKTFVEEALGLAKVNPNAVAKKVETPENKIEKKAEPKVEEPKPQPEVKKEELKEGEPTPDSSKASEEPKKEEPKEEKAPKEKKERKRETTVKVKPSKATVYDRGLDTHKALMGQFLDQEFPGWRLPEILKKAGTASRALHGTDFQDSEGNILESFKAAFRPYMA